MSYDEKYRRRTLEYRGEGYSLAKVFKVAINTIRNWERQLNTEGHLQKHTFVRFLKKLPLKNYAPALKIILMLICVRLRRLFNVVKLQYVKH